MTVKNIPAKVRINNIDQIVELTDTETLTNKRPSKVIQKIFFIFQK
jgi:hypothetical protein